MADDAELYVRAVEDGAEHNGEEGGLGRGASTRTRCRSASQGPSGDVEAFAAVCTPHPFWSAASAGTWRPPGHHGKCWNPLRHVHESPGGFAPAVPATDLHASNSGSENMAQSQLTYFSLTCWRRKLEDGGGATTHVMADHGWRSGHTYDGGPHGVRIRPGRAGPDVLDAPRDRTRAGDGALPESWAAARDTAYNPEWRPARRADAEGAGTRAARGTGPPDDVPEMRREPRRHGSGIGRASALERAAGLEGPAEQSPRQD